jgi:hypothetical protein
MYPLSFNRWTQSSQDNLSSVSRKWFPIRRQLRNASRSTSALSRSLLVTFNFCTTGSNVAPYSTIAASSDSSPVARLDWGSLQAASPKLLVFGPLDPSPKEVSFSFPFHRASRGRDSLSKVSRTLESLTYQPQGRGLYAAPFL